MRRQKIAQGGFTLVEVSVSLMMMGVVLAVVMLLWRVSTENYAAGFEEVQQLDQVTQSARQMMNEIREARDGDDGSYPLAEALDQEIIFFSDVDSDGRTERIHYLLSGNELRRGMVEPTGDPPTYELSNETWKVIANTVNNQTTPVFTFYDRNYPGDEVNNPLVESERLLNTRAVKLHLVISLSDNFAAGEITWDTMVKMRNQGRIE